MTVRNYRVTVDGVSLAVQEFGAADASDIVVCAHGLTRNSHDFDRLAAVLAKRRRVVSFDAAGRGDSDWLPDPDGYNYATYQRHALALLDYLSAPAVDWIGTSMGGMTGMLLAARTPERVKSLALNDIGAMIPRAALTRILDSVRALPSFADSEAVLAHFRQRYASFGAIDDAGWRHLAQHGVRREADGRLHLAFDPRIAQALQGSDRQDVTMWDLWAAIRQPVLLLRGAASDVLLSCTAKGMAARGNVKLVEFPGAGHAPSLLMPDQIDAIAGWLAA